MRCSVNTKIVIVKADFGRDQYSIACGDFLYEDNCFVEVTKIVNDVCGNKKDCDIIPSAQVLQNTCDGNTQLLRVWYQCVGDGNNQLFFKKEFLYI